MMLHVLSTFLGHNKEQYVGVQMEEGLCLVRGIYLDKTEMNLQQNNETTWQAHQGDKCCVLILEQI